MTRAFGGCILLAFLAAGLLAEEAQDAPAPAVDRVGFPKDYREKFAVLRSVNRSEKQQVVTVFGNEMAASITSADQLPYPYGSILVMETASVQKDSQGKPLLDAKGSFRRDQVVGLHVMRREQNFGEAYGKNRTGEWEYVEYRADGGYITPPQKSFACAECHVKAGRERDYVYRGRFPAEEVK
jgi:Cytochrome P460